MRIVWLSRARADISHARKYIEQYDPESARRVILTIYQVVRHISEAPNIGRPGRVASTREFVVSHTSYIVAYTVIKERIIILAVIHEAQEWPDTL